MTECYEHTARIQSFGYKRNHQIKNYQGWFELVDAGNKFEIWSLQIRERYRNKGYGTRMLTEFISQFSFEKPLVLYVHKTNEIAIRLYEKVGFKIIGECKFAPYAYEMQYFNRKENKND